MTSDAAQDIEKPESETSDDEYERREVKVRFITPKIKADYSTILGLAIAIGLIAAAILAGNNSANFFNAPAFMIVILGTFAATSVSYTGEELRHAPGIIGNTLFRKVYDESAMATQLVDIALFAKKKGNLGLGQLESQIQKDPFLLKAVLMVSDGLGDDVDRVLGQELDALIERHRRAASMLKRAADIAPAMGLIGTLVGLVQMLAQLDNPSSIGPSMAIALLTTFYGAILGTIILGPLAAKLERNSNDEATIKGLILTAMTSIVRQENPRRLEMQLNSALPPASRINYFE